MWPAWILQFSVSLLSPHWPALLSCWQPALQSRALPPALLHSWLAGRATGSNSSTSLHRTHSPEEALTHEKNVKGIWKYTFVTVKWVSLSPSSIPSYWPQERASSSALLTLILLQARPMGVGSPQGPRAPCSGPSQRPSGSSEGLRRHPRGPRHLQAFRSCHPQRGLTKDVLPLLLPAPGPGSAQQLACRPAWPSAG